MNTLKIGKTEFQVTSTEEMVLGMMEKTYTLKTLDGKRHLSTVRCVKDSSQMLIVTHKGPGCKSYLTDAGGTLKLV